MVERDKKGEQSDLTFQTFNFHGVIKCLSMKNETHFVD